MKVMTESGGGDGCGRTEGLMEAIFLAPDKNNDAFWLPARQQLM
jgi:hypothetical protein